MSNPRPSSSIETLLDIMRRLRAPNGGCPWDLEQNFSTIAPYTIEEAYEVAEAIAQDDLTALKEELGDLLLQVVFHAQMAHELGAFDFNDVARTIADKMVRRHPHVFGSAQIDDAASQTLAWEEQKAAERAAKALKDGRQPSQLDGVSVALPGLSRAIKLQQRAARVGFDWTEPEPILAKIAEEIDEVRAEMVADPRDPASLEDEIGDVLFACANLARHLGVDPEAAIRGTNRKFERRFRRIEDLLRARGERPGDVSLAALETLWQQAKSEEK
jgi:ATP diphosphatase